MEKLVTEQYRKTLNILYKEGMGGSSIKWVDPVFAMIVASRSFHFKGRFETSTVLDYGCGQGKLKKALRPMLRRIDIDDKVDIREYDPGVPGKDELPEPADFVICSDVLEHVEPECLEDVLTHLYYVTKKFALIVIALNESNTVMPDGRNAHLIIEDTNWWKKKVRDAGLWDVSEFPTSINRKKRLVLTTYK